MNTWMSEKELRQSGSEAKCLAINVPFLQEIKQDFEFRQLLTRVYRQLNGEGEPPVSPRMASEILSQLRDELETYFALEEFYGYFKHSAETNPSVCRESEALRREHEKLYLQFNQIVEMSEQIVYHECSTEIGIAELAEKLERFCETLARHEQDEMDLMMRMCNEDIGVGD